MDTMKTKLEPRIAETSIPCASVNNEAGGKSCSAMVCLALRLCHMNIAIDGRVGVHSLMSTVRRLFRLYYQGRAPIMARSVSV